MAIHEHLTQFGGRPVRDWNPGESLQPGVCHRISVSYEEAENAEKAAAPAPPKAGLLARIFGVKKVQPPVAPALRLWEQKFSRFLSAPGIGQVEGIVTGTWGEPASEGPEAIATAIISAAKVLPNLKALFFGDIVMEECEISWINQTNVGPLVEAFPGLEYFGVRGGESLRLGPVRHDKLRHIEVQTGGLDKAVIHDICQSKIPALEHLELWLGMDQYGGNTQVQDLQPILRGGLFPRLRYLGLSDSERQDEIAAAVAKAPVLDGLRVLDLSKGTLTDTGAAALLESPAVRKLESLDLHHHYLSEEQMAKFRRLGIPVNLEDRQEPEEENYRFVAVGE